MYCSIKNVFSLAGNLVKEEYFIPFIVLLFYFFIIFQCNFKLKIIDCLVNWWIKIAFYQTKLNNTSNPKELLGAQEKNN